MIKIDNKANLFNINISIQKINQILIFIDKKYRKKIINIYGLFNQFKQALYKKQIYCIYFKTPYIIKFLYILKINNIIFNFYIISPSYFKIFLLFNKTYFFLNNLIIIYFNYLINTNNQIIRIISKPSRLIYIKWKNLCHLNKNDEKEYIYILNTTYGLVTHHQAKKLKIGGQVVCLLY
jgi:ribosomal protein S8